jgi:selenide,water dikinase
MGKVGGVDLMGVIGGAYGSVPDAGVAPTAKPEDCAVLPPIAGSLLMTLDYGPLVGPNMYRAGRIAATHAISDVHAMGGTPHAALALLTVDLQLPRGAGTDVQAGMVAACLDEGIEIVGGQTVEGQEAMAGLSVLGVAGDVLLTKRGARPGDVVMLSKPVGVGLVVRAWRQGFLGAGDLEAALVTMETSNGAASRAAVKAGAVAATDVTGFGLLGHLSEMLRDDGLGAILSLKRIPVLTAVTRIPVSFARSRWIDNNLSYCRERTRLSLAGGRERLAPLLDPQTSGGLLVMVPAAGAEQLRRAGYRAIGSVIREQRLEIAA